MQDFHDRELPRPTNCIELSIERSPIHGYAFMLNSFASLLRKKLLDRDIRLFECTTYIYNNSRPLYVKLFNCLWQLAELHDNYQCY